MSKINPKQKEIILIVFSLFILITSIVLVVYSLTFLIKNINLILKPNLNSNNLIHFNLEEAQKIFSSSTAPTTF